MASASVGDRNVPLEEGGGERGRRRGRGEREKERGGGGGGGGKGGRGEEEGEKERGGGREEEGEEGAGRLCGSREKGFWNLVSFVLWELRAALWVSFLFSLICRSQFVPGV